MTKEQINFLQNNSTTICKDDLLHPNWGSLFKNIKNKSIILLGEFTHGAKEIFQLSNSLIKYLHQKLGINTILFESGIGELISADINQNTLLPSQMTNYVTFRFEATPTHQGPLMGIAATNKKVNASGIVIHKVENGRFAKSWNEVDLLGLRMQLDQK